MKTTLGELRKLISGRVLPEADLSFDEWGEIERIVDNVAETLAYIRDAGHKETPDMESVVYSLKNVASNVKRAIDIIDGREDIGAALRAYRQRSA